MNKDTLFGNFGNLDNQNRNIENKEIDLDKIEILESNIELLNQTIQREEEKTKNIDLINLDSEYENNDEKIGSVIEVAKIKKYISIAVGITFIIIIGFAVMLFSSTKVEMFNATGKTKSEVIAEFKNEYGKTLHDDNFLYLDGGIKSKENTVFDQNPLNGSKFDKKQNVNEFIFKINKRKKADVMLNDDFTNVVKHVSNTKKSEQANKNKFFIVQNYMFRPFSEVKAELLKQNVKFKLEFKLTNSEIKEGFISNQNYLSKTSLKTDSNVLVLTIYTRDPQKGPTKYATSKFITVNTMFGDTDPRNPNIKKDSSVIWRWTKGEVVNFKNYKGIAPLSCYSRVCYYDSKGNPTPYNLEQQNLDKK